MHQRALPDMVVEGEDVRAFVQPNPSQPHFVRIHAEKRDGTPVLTGTASVGDTEGLPYELPQRIAKLRPPTGLVINRDLKVGQRGAVVEKIRMGFDTHMGDHYPFTLADKLKVITEPSPWYSRESGAESQGMLLMPKGAAAFEEAIAHEALVNRDLIRNIGLKLT